MATVQALPDIVLTKPPFPGQSSSNSLNGIRQDLSFCSVCCNLFPGSAFSLTPRSDIAVHEHTGIENAEAAKAAGVCAGDGLVPAWAGVSRVDFASWQFTARLQDVAEAADQGCSSCHILRQGIENICLDTFTSEEVYWEIEVVFCLGDVLRVALYCCEGEEETDIFGNASGPGERRHVTNLEFYTLPGKTTFRDPFEQTLGDTRRDLLLSVFPT